MRLVLVRHAEAEPLRVSDADRQLTARGIVQARETAAWINRQAWAGPMQLLSSPFVRARQTADAIARVMSLKPEFCDALTPDTDPRIALRAIEQAIAADNLIVVSHMPLVACLEHWLESGVVSAGSGFMLAEVRVLVADVLAPSAAAVETRYWPQ